MSRNKLLLDVIKDVRSLADSLQAMADAMKSDESQGEPVKKPQKPSKAEEKKAQSAKKECTLEDVRAVLAEKSRKGHTAAVKDLLIKHGANKLSEIDPKNYEALLADAEVL
ncbi:rRNA biogenesis protein rrp5 [Anaerotignum sp.]|uniref:rRNA biogenesis protein rrp5 n=1 Tax=Anaerotignum sp. TaxID=2039241 RepID=UPI00332BA8AF